MDKEIVVTPRIRVSLDELSFSYARSSGPGGQNVNKVSTKAILRWPVATSPALPESVRQRFLQLYRRRITSEGELVLSSQRYRDQQRNVDDCLEKLKALLEAAATEPRPRKATRPTKASRERRLKQKRETSKKKSQRRPELYE